MDAHLYAWTRRLLFALVGLNLCANIALAQEGEIGGARFSLARVGETVLPSGDDRGGALGALGEAAPAKARFGDRHSAWGTVGAGVTRSFSGDSIDYNATFSFTYFIIQDVEVTGEAGVWYFNQEGDNAAGFNPCMVFRWHFWQSEDYDWTVYVDAGIGTLFATDNVPERGTSFDVTPRIGIGLTKQLTDEGLRLQAGLRWAHISNARILGDDQNPSRDGPMLYVGLMFPF